MTIINSLVALVITAQTMSFRFGLACKGLSTEKAQHLVIQQKVRCCFIGRTFTLFLKLGFFTIIYAVFRE